MVTQLLCSFLSGKMTATVYMIFLHCTLLAYKRCPSLKLKLKLARAKFEHIWLWPHVTAYVVDKINLHIFVILNQWIFYYCTLLQSDCSISEYQSNKLHFWVLYCSLNTLLIVLSNLFSTKPLIIIWNSTFKKM